VAFDDPNLVSDSGLLMLGTLAKRVGLAGLLRRWVLAGSLNSTVKAMTVLMGKIGGGDHYRRTRLAPFGVDCRVLGSTPLAPSAIGTFLRTSTFGHVRQLDAVNSRLPANASAAGAGPWLGEALVVDSTPP